MRLASDSLSRNSMMFVILGLLLGLGTLPVVLRGRLRSHKEALRIGHLKTSPDRERATWDPQYDFFDAQSKDWVKRPGFLLRILPWIGPAIGMSLADVFGRGGADVIMVLAALFLGYTLTSIGILAAALQFLEFRRLERELGRPILLIEEPNTEQVPQP